MKHIISKQTLADRLKRYRKESGLSVKELAAKLSEYEIIIDPKTIYNWEECKSQPSAEVLMCLLDIYNLSPILKALGYRASHNYEDTEYMELSNTEVKLIEAFRNQPEHRKSVLKLYDLDDIYNA